MPPEATPPRGGPTDPGDLLKALEASAAKADWVPLFTDDFGRTSLGDDWRIVGGQGRIENGWLRLAARGGDVYAILRRPFPDNIRIEFDARFPAGPGYCSDLACFVAGDEHKCDMVGYCLSLGADGNTCSRIQRQGIDVRIKPGFSAEPGRSYRLAAERLGGELRLLVDGEVVLRYVDLVPLAGVGHDRLGLASFSRGAEFSAVRVLTRAEPEGSGAFVVADTYCRDGLYDQAIAKYRQVAAAHSGKPLELLAQCKAGLALFAAARWGEADAQFRGLVRMAKGTEMEHLVELWRAQALAMLGKLDEALHLFGRVQSEATDPGIVDEVAVACGLLTTRLKGQARWLEAGRCAKFLFEKLKTPLVQTGHMFGVYGRRLHEAALFQEEHEVASRLAAVMRNRPADPNLVPALLTCAATAVLSGHADEAKHLYDELDERARKTDDAGLELRVLVGRAETDLSLGRYSRALERLVPLAGSEREDTHVAGAWGATPADLRAAALLLLGRTGEVLEDLDAGRISPDALDLRFILAAELRRNGHQAGALACLAELEENMAFGAGAALVERAAPAIRGETPVETLQEYVDTTLQPALQPLGIFLIGLTLWSGGEDDAAVMAWSEAKNACPDTIPAWHWANLFLGRAASK
jgi:tetratricopeptide (TPR) repeat protein